MSKAVKNLEDAQKLALQKRPKVGGFPYLAETLRQAGVSKNIWHLPACQSVYLTDLGPVVMQLPPLFVATAEIPKFDREALIRALRTDQAGQTSFPEFLKNSWEAGVVNYVVNFIDRKVTYYGAHGDFYDEAYPAVEL